MSLARIELPPLPAAAADLCEAALAPWCSVLVRTLEDGAIRLSGWLAEPCPEAGAAASGILARIAAGLAVAAAAAGILPPKPVLVPVAGRDWLAENREAFRAFRLGRFFIRGEEERGAVPADLFPLTLDAGIAFGTGRHASTAGCLLALADRRIRAPAAAGGGVLDLGCGSGILAIAAAKLLPGEAVIATDNDARAVAAAGANARRNGVQGRVRTVVAAAGRHPMINAAAPFRLILANILARPLIRFAPEVARLAGDGTRLILAGFVAADAAHVAAAYAGHGFRRERRLDRDGWTTLVLARRHQAKRRLR